MKSNSVDIFIIFYSPGRKLMDLMLFNWLIRYIWLSSLYIFYSFNLVKISFIPGSNAYVLEENADGSIGLKHIGKEPPASEEEELMNEIINEAKTLHFKPRKIKRDDIEGADDVVEEVQEVKSEEKTEEPQKKFIYDDIEGQSFFSYSLAFFISFIQ